MIGMIRAPRPARVDERIVKRLLNVVDDTDLVISDIVREEPMTRGGLFDDVFMTRANGACQITCQKIDDSRLMRRRHTACLLSTATRLGTGFAVGDTLGGDQMLVAEPPATQQARSNGRDRQAFGAFGAQ
jgi:hypothetical protein